MTAPLSAVLSAVSTGANTVGEIATRTGLSPDVVDAAVEHLRRMGKIGAVSLSSGCPDGGCTGCGSPSGSGCLTIGPPPVRG
ncbi:MAG: hypothetical protein IPO93_11730 [Actinobacteria bacterium]|nr:hypothetical protein [Actinomycetota bacterium]